MSNCRVTAFGRDRIQGGSDNSDNLVVQNGSNHTEDDVLTLSSDRRRKKTLMPRVPLGHHDTTQRWKKAYIRSSNAQDESLIEETLAGAKKNQGMHA